MSDSCTVTNNTGGSVAILTPVQSTSPNLSQLGTVFNNMEVCKLSPSGSISNGATATVTLDETTVGSNNQSQPATSYDLVACETVWYQPVASVSIDNISSPFSSQTLTLPNNTVMQDTAKFLQYISAYPSSKMTQLYTAAAQSAQNAGNAAINSGSSSTDPNAPVNAFFATTQNFQDVTIGSVAAMQAYYQNFPCVWAEYKKSVTYYLYAAASSGTNTLFMGTITLTLSGNLDLTKSNAGYTCTFTPAKTPSDLTSVTVDSSKTLSLTYANGQFNDAGDVPHVAVSGLFQLLSTFTQNPSDNSIITVLTGTINGQTAMGFDTSQATQPGKPQPILDFSTPAATFSSVLEIGSALQTLYMFYDGCNRIRNYVNKQKKRAAAQEKNKASQKDVQDDNKLTSQEKSEELSKLEAQSKELDSASESETASLKKLLGGDETLLNNKLKKLSPDGATNPKDLGAADAKLNAASQLKQLKQINKASGEQIETMVKDGASKMTSQQLQGVEKAAVKVRATDAQLNKPVPPDQLQATVAQAKPEVASNKTEIDDLLDEIEKLMDENTKAKLQQSKLASDNLTEDMQKVEDESTEISDGSKSGDADPLIGESVHVEVV